MDRREFLNQSLCTISWPEVFQFVAFMSDVFWEFRCLPQVLLQVVVIRLSFDLPIRPFCDILSVHIFNSKFVLLPLLKVAGLAKYFLLFLWNLLFCLYCFNQIQYLLCLPSLANTFFFNLFKLYSLACLLICFGLFILMYPDMLVYSLVLSFVVVSLLAVLF